MQKIEAVIRTHKLDDVKQALHDIGVQGLTVSEVSGFGRQKGHEGTYRGVEYTIDLVPKRKIEVVVSDDQSDAVIQAILESAKTGEIGDGKIFVTELKSCVRIRTGETGEGAL